MVSVEFSADLKCGSSERRHISDKLKAAEVDLHFYRQNNHLSFPSLLLQSFSGHSAVEVSMKITDNRDINIEKSLHRDQDRSDSTRSPPLYVAPP